MSNKFIKKIDSDDKKIVMNVTPTFLLKGVDPVNIFNKYLTGYYNNIPIPSNKVNFSSNNLSLAPQYGSNGYSETYVYRDKNNTQQIVATTNHSQYSLVRSSDGKELSIDGKCMWCRSDIISPPIGIPIIMEYHNNEYKFHVDGKCDTFECCYSLLKTFTKLSYIYRDPLYIDSESMLLLMYSIIHPNSPRLKPAPDWRVLKDNGGWMSLSEFRSESHYYQRTPNFILLPLKIEYTINK